MRKLFHVDTQDHGSGPTSEEERLALLRYMLRHNEHHAEELHALAHGAPEPAEALLHAAVANLEDSNKKIAEALALLEEK